MHLWLDGLTLAYLDPGTGSYALQILMASLFGGMFALRHSWSEVKLRLSARLGRDGSGIPHAANARHHVHPTPEPE